MHQFADLADALLEEHRADVGHVGSGHDRLEYIVSRVNAAAECQGRLNLSIQNCSPAQRQPHVGWCAQSQVGNDVPCLHVDVGLHEAVEEDHALRSARLQLAHDVGDGGVERAQLDGDGQGDGTPHGLEGLEEDAAIFSGLMLKVKQSFGKAADEHLQSSYELWENFDKEMPSTREKISKVISLLDPLEKKLKIITDLISKIDKWQIDKLNESISLMATNYGKSKEMVEFLIKNFKPKENSNGTD